MRLAVLFFTLGCCCAQDVRRDVIVVTGTYEPVALDEVDRAVTALPVREQLLVSNTIADFLRLDPSLDLRQRAPNGVQSDLSIRGGNFGQTLVLLNGQRLNDVQSGHHNLDIPTPLESVARIEILRGAGSTMYGSDAVGGVVNIITQPPEGAEAKLRAAGGNFGVNQQRISLAASAGRISQHLALSRDFSSGFQPNRDYRNLSIASSTHAATGWGPSDITLGYSDRPFGADKFYGNFNSWENTKTWFASLQQGLGSKTTAGFAFRRHSDLFVLYRDRPEVFANHHAVESYQASLRRRENLSSIFNLYYGVEAFREAIQSNNLGRHARARAAGYAALDVRALRRFSFSVGAREEVYRNVTGQFSPSLSGGVWLNSRLKLRAGASRAFRLPTYTDLYYHDPANLGSPDLRPESAWSYEAGLDLHATRNWRADVTVFHRRETDGIDYIRRSDRDIWRATNIHKLRFTGVEASLHMASAWGQLDMSYTGLRGAQTALAGVLSKYVFNYPSHSGVMAWLRTLPGGVLVRSRLGVLKRFARDPYALWDVYVASTKSRLHPFVHLTNISSTRYEEIPGVVMPGRAIVGGLEVVLYPAK